jgi:hypothetical protein
MRLDKPIRQNYTTAANFPLIARRRSGATINWLRRSRIACGNGIKDILERAHPGTQKYGVLFA